MTRMSVVRVEATNDVGVVVGPHPAGVELVAVHWGGVAMLHLAPAVAADVGKSLVLAAEEATA